VEGGKVKCWGRNDLGQLGNGQTVDSANRVEVPGLHDAKSISAGQWHACALLADDTVTCWGGNESGEVGAGAVLGNVSVMPTPVPNLEGVTAMSAAWSYTCVLLADETVRCWGTVVPAGETQYGFLGDGTTAGSITPVAVSNLANVIGISRGCAMTRQRKAWCWGRNYIGQLGDGTTTDSDVPVAVSDLDDVAAIESDDDFACALRLDGTGACWGDNAHGETGTGDTSQLPFPPVPKPATILSLSGATAITPGAYHACALIDDGSMRCWGQDDSGELGDQPTAAQFGDRETADEFSPVVVSGVGDVTAIAAGWSITCAILSGDTVECWGTNFHDGLGPQADSLDTCPNGVWGTACSLTPIVVCSDRGGSAVSCSR
jgi:alpha-tubulin suppressor-like RCC1 family protein